MKRFKPFVLVVLAIIALMPASQSGAVQYNDLVTGNPVLPGYFADPCCRKFGDTYYMYVTPDGWGVGEGPFCIWTSKDFVHWTSNKSNWPTTNNKWAPSVVYANNKYYMYTQVPCQVWVGVSSSPLGPWTNGVAAGGCLVDNQVPTGTITLDGECFIDDLDGQAYLWYGCWWTPTVVKLNPDLVSTVPGSAIQYFGSNTPKGTVTGCMEAPYIFKRNGTYYLMYSNDRCEFSTYKIEYSTSNSPLGPWTYGANNPIVSTNADNTVDGPGHHTMLEDGGKVYIIYHRHDNPHSIGGAYRQTCIDELRFNADGSIQKIDPTHSGIRYLAPSTKRDTNWVIDRSLTVTATASTYAGPDYAPACAADENNGTIWKASSYTYPQWLQIDLGQSKSIKRIETEFEFAQVGYKYKIEYSTNGTTWSLFADRLSNTNWGPMIDSLASAVNARYVKITMTGDNYASRPNPQIGIWNLKLYDGVDKPNQAPWVDAGPDRTGSVSFTTMPVHGNVIDDGLPNGPVAYSWSKASGPGSVTFANPDRLDTTATFSAAGTYVLQLTANDGALTAFDTVTYNITATPGNVVLSYSFDEPGGTLVKDASNNARDGLFGSSDPNIKNNPKRGSGIVGRSVSFDGTNDYIAVPSLGTYDSLSIAAWVKLDSLADYSTILAGNGSPTGSPQLTVRGTGEIQFSVVGCNPVDRKSTFKLTDKYLGRWIHIAVVYDKSAKKVTFYIDGKPEAAQSYTTAQTIAMTGGARLGCWDSPSRYLDGKIDELAVYNKALTQAEITGLVNSAQGSKISDAKALADGQTATISAKAVTYAPRNASGVRCTPYFYTEEPDRSGVLRVDDGLTGLDSADVENGITLTGVMRTSTTTGERYLEMTAPAEIESGQAVAPILTTTKMIETDPNLVGMLVKFAGKVKTISTDTKTLTISDGYYKNGLPATTTIKSESAVSLISAGNTVSIVGVVSKTGTTPATATRVVLLRDIRRIDPPVTPVTSGLICWYKFDETTGTTASDSSGNARTGNLVNGPLFASGKMGNAVNLDGSDDHVRLPNGIMQGVNDFTICTWVKLDRTPQWSRIFDFGSGTDSYMFLCLQDNVGIRYAIKLSGTGEQVLDYNTPMPTGAWKHVAVTQTGNTLRIYMNGILVATNTGITYKPTSLGATTQDYIGKSQYGDPLLDGKVDDFRIYNRALSASEVLQIANCY